MSLSQQCDFAPILDAEPVFTVEASIQSGLMAWREKSSLSDGVHRIFSVRADKQMLGIDASRHIACVADNQSGWDGSIEGLPRQTMGIERSPIDRHHPVAVFGGVPEPQPTAITVMADIGEQSFFDWLSGASTLHSACIH